MLDRDLAALYGVENRVLKQAVRRNINRFPYDFMFVLSKKEYQSIKITKCDLKKMMNTRNQKMGLQCDWTLFKLYFIEIMIQIPYVCHKNDDR